MELRHIIMDFRTPRLPKKSRATYQAEYRDRLKRDSQQWRDYKTKQKVYMKNYLDSLTEEEKQAKRDKKNQRRRERRKAQKQSREETVRETTSSVSVDPSVKKKTRKAVQESRAYWRERKKIQREKMTPEQREAFNKKANERRKQNRLLKRVNSLSTTTQLLTTPCHPSVIFSHPIAVSTPNITESTKQTIKATPSVTFSPTLPTPHPTSLSQSPSPTKNAKYSSLKRVRPVLPKSKKSKRYVLTKLLQSCSPATKKYIIKNSMSSEVASSTHSLPTKQKKTRKRKDSILKQKIVEFYETVALNLPDKKYFSKRLNKQRKVLDRPISVIYLDFIAKYPNLKVSSRNFYKCRPEGILKMKSLKFRHCLCETCENMNLMFKAFGPARTQYLSVTDAMKSTLCPYEGDWPSFSCVDRTCENCGTRSLKEDLKAKCDLSESVAYKYWELVADKRCKGKKTKLVNKQCTVRELISLFIASMEKFSLHKHTDKWQRHQFNDLKKSLPFKHTVIVLDYAENYTCIYQDQAQAAYYGLDQVTVHPVVMYTHCPVCEQKHTSYRIYVSDDLKHDSHFVHHVLKDTLLSRPSDSKFIIFSDNCPTQYKSRVPVFNHSKLAEEFSFERCYFGERHGKSECDSIGGVVKSFLTQSVASGRAVLTNASDIFNFLNDEFQLLGKNCPHSLRSFHLVKRKSINRSVSTANIPLVKGIKKVHSFKFLDSGRLVTRPFSCFCTQCMSGFDNQCCVQPFEQTEWLRKPCGHRKNAGSDKGCFDGEAGEKNNDNNSDGLAGDGDDVRFEVNEQNSPIRAEDDADCGENGLDLCGCSGERVFDKCDNSTGRVIADDVVSARKDNEDGGYANDVIDFAGDDIAFSKCSRHKVVDENGDNCEVVSVDAESDWDKVVYNERCRVDVVLDVFDTGEEVKGVIASDDHMQNGLGIPYELRCEPSKPVKRQLFTGTEITLVSASAHFKQLYDGMTKCKTFQDLVRICKLHRFEDLRVQPKSFKINLDYNALKLVPPNTPQGYLPNVTIGDGNCIPRSLSTLIFGTENRHLEIRCRIIHELALNKSLYLDKDFLSLGSKVDPESILYRISTLSDALSGVSIDDVEQVFEKEVFHTRLLSRYLGLWHLHAAAKILGRGIISLYPLLGPSEITELFARAFVPLSFQSDETLYILWTSNRKDMKTDNWVANHVVPMIKLFK